MDNTSKTDNDVSGFCSEKYVRTSSQKGDHECCKCVKNNTSLNDAGKNIILKTSNYIHFCGLDDNKICTSSTQIDTFISDSSRSEDGSPKKRSKVILSGWEPARLEISLQDFYSLDVMTKHISPKCKFERGTIVWTKVTGYPTWPGMIDNDPDEKTFWYMSSGTPPRMHYHVVFFDEDNFLSRCWNSEDKIKPFSRQPIIKFSSVVTYKRFQAGLKQAHIAATMCIRDRIDIYGFAAKLRQPNVILVEN